MGFQTRISARCIFVLFVAAIGVGCGSTATKLDGEFNSALARLEFENARTLLAQGADINAKFDDKITNLHWGAAGGRPDVIRFLLDHGAHLESRDTWDETPLMTAAKIGHLEATKILVEAGADPTARDIIGRTAVALAREAGHDEVVDYLDAASASAEPRASALPDASGH